MFTAPKTVLLYRAQPVVLALPRRGIILSSDAGLALVSLLVRFSSLYLSLLCEACTYAAFGWFTSVKAAESVSSA